MSIAELEFSDYDYLSRYPNVDIPAIGDKKELLDLLVVSVNEEHYLCPLEIDVNILIPGEVYMGYIPCLSQQPFNITATRTTMTINYPYIKVNTDYSHIGIIITDRYRVIAAGVINLVEKTNIFAFKTPREMEMYKGNKNIGQLKSTFLSQPILFYRRLQNGNLQLLTVTQPNIGLIPNYVYDFYIPKLKIRGELHVPGRTMIIVIPDTYYIVFEEPLSIIIMDEWEHVILGTKLQFKQV